MGFAPTIEDAASSAEAVDSNLILKVEVMKEDEKT